jgi:hypothetical protein
MTLVLSVPRDARKRKMEKMKESVTQEPHWKFIPSGRGVPEILGGHSTVRVCRITRQCVEAARWRGSINS